MFRNLRRKLFGNFSIGVLFVEFISIVIAIFLGNMASNWNNNRIQAKEAEEALQQMCVELAQNHSNLRYYYNYYSRMLTLMDSLAAIDQIDKLTTMKEYQSLNPPIIYTFAYEMAKSSNKLADIKHEKAIYLFHTYSALEGLKETNTNSTALLLNNQIETAIDWSTSFNIYKEYLEYFYKKYEQLEEKEICSSNNQPLIQWHYEYSISFYFYALSPVLPIPIWWPFLLV